MSIVLTGPAERDFQKLPAVIRKKTLKQLALLDINIRHPSRLTFQKEGDTFTIRKMGQHDEGLGKK